MNNPTVITKETGKDINPGAVVINQLIIRPVDRTTKDIATWRNAHGAATNSYHPNRSALYDLYDDVMLDGHLTGIISKRIDAVLNKTLHFTKADKTVDEMNPVIESEVFRDVVTKILESKLQGLSGLEFLPGKELCFEEIPRKHIKPEKGVISYEQSEITGINYLGLENVWIIGKRNDLGVLLKCSPYALWKRGDLADWSQYVEIFGQPVRIMKYDAYDLKTKMELQMVVDSAGSSLAMLIPKQADFEMMDGKQSNGDGALQEKLMTACNNEMSVIVLGNTETTTSSKSSGYAQSKEHGKQQIEVTKSDLKFVANHLNSAHFLRILQTYGLPVAGGRFEFEIEVDLAELSAKKDIDLAVSAKVPVADDYWYEKYDIPKPDNYDELKAKMEEEKQAKLNPQQPPAPAQKPKPKPAAKKQDLAADDDTEMQTTWWTKFRTELADFFDPAR